MLFALKNLRKYQQSQAKDDLKKAEDDLKKCIADGHYICTLWARAYLARLQNAEDANWPVVTESPAFGVMPPFDGSYSGADPPSSVPAANNRGRRAHPRVL